MAYGRRLTGALTAAALAMAASGVRADECEVERWRTGIAVGTTDAGFAVVAIDDASPAATGGLRAGDVVLQANGIVPRTCDDWARAVGDARRDRKALLVLVRRPAGEVPLVLGAATWDRVPPAPQVVTAPGGPVPAPAGKPIPPPRPAEAPTVREVVAAPPPAIPAPSQPDVGEVVQRIAKLDECGDRAAYQAELERLHAAVRALGAGAAVPRPVVSGLETVLRYHDAAGVAWKSEDAARERERRPRRLPSAEAMVAPFFTDSEEESAIAAFPFLEASVVRLPARGMVGEAGGQWRPVQARQLLWEGARGQEERLATWLGMAGRGPLTVP